MTARDARACSSGEGGPAAGRSEPCLAPTGAAPRLPQGVRPRLSLAASVAAAPAVKEGHEEAGSGAGARVPAGAGAGAAAAAPRPPNWRFGASSEGDSERLLFPPQYGSRLPTFVWCCCNAAETPQKAAALIISWEANERSRQGICLYSRRAWHQRRPRSPLPWACGEQPVASPAVVWRHERRAEEGTGHPCPSYPWGGCSSSAGHGAAGTARHRHFIQGLSARATCCHSTHGQGICRHWRARSFEPWGRSRPRGHQSIPYGAGRRSRVTAKRRAHPKHSQRRQPTLGTQSCKWPKSLPKKRGQAPAGAQPAPQRRRCHGGRASLRQGDQRS